MGLLMLNNESQPDLRRFQIIFMLSGVLLVGTALNLLFKYVKTSSEHSYFSILFFICYGAILVFTKEKYAYFSNKLKLILLASSLALSGLFIVLFCRPN